MNENIYVNGIIQWEGKAGKTLVERILWLDGFAKYAYVINIYHDKDLPILRKLKK